MLPIMPPRTVPPMRRPSDGDHSSASDDSLMMRSPRVCQQLRLDKQHGLFCCSTIVRAGSGLAQLVINLGLGVTAYTLGERRQPSGNVFRGDTVCCFPCATARAKVEFGPCG